MAVCYTAERCMKRPAQVSYGVMVLTFVLAAWLGLATPFITILFSYFALQKLSYRSNKAVAVVLFTLVVLLAGYGFGYFFHEAIQELPKIADNAIPAIMKFANEHNLQLPFTDLESLRTVVMETVVEEVHYFGKRATLVGKQVVFFVIGIVVAISLFFNAR